MKKILKRGAGVISCLAARLIVAALLIVWRPEWFATPSLISKAVVTFGAPYHPTWRSFEPRIKSMSFARKNFSLHADEFCVKDSSESLNACFDNIDASLEIALTWRGAYLDRIQRLVVTGRRIALDQTRAAKRPAAQAKAKKGYRGLPAMLPRALSRMRIDSVDVWMPDNSVVMSATRTISGDVAIYLSSADGHRLEISSLFKDDRRTKAENIDVKLAIDSDLFSQGPLSYLSARGRLEGDAGNSGTVDARVEQKSAREMVLTASASVKNGRRELTAQATASRTPEGYKGHLSSALQNASASVRALTIDRCDGSLAVDEESQPKDASVECRLSVEPAAPGAARRFKGKKINLLVDLDGALKAHGLTRDAFEATLRATVVPRKDWYDFGASLKVDLAGRLGDLPRSLRSKHVFNASLKIARFEDLVAYLGATAYAIPAPFHVLRGPLDFQIDNSGDTRGPDHEFSYRLRSDLTSGRQRLKAAIDGALRVENAFTPNRSIKNKTGIRLSELAFELPYLSIGKLPPVTIDRRITTGPSGAVSRQEALSAAKKTPSSAVDYTIDIVTEKPILLFSNINPAPIPIAVDLTARPGGMSGEIAVRRFDAELFRKRGVVEHVTLATAPGSRAMALDGLIKFRQDEIDIFVKLLGSSEKPRVVFESEPPLDQQAIISLLLFNKAPDDLDPDQSASVSNSQSAMASGAFGLASLYLFASTPIQHVGYDPATQTYAIKFSLPGGASLEVGSGADQSRHLTLRKRLARRWVLQTELRRDPEEERSAVTTFLEWFQRY